MSILIPPPVLTRWLRPPPCSFWETCQSYSITFWGNAGLASYFVTQSEHGEETEFLLGWRNSGGSPKKQESSRKKTSTSALLTMPKPLAVWIMTNCGKFLKRWEYQTTWPASWEICIQVKKQQLVRTEHGTIDWFQIGKGLHQSCILSPCIFKLQMQSTSCEMPGWMKHKLESRLPWEISITSDRQMTPPLWQKVKN